LKVSSEEAKNIFQFLKDHKNELIMNKPIAFLGEFRKNLNEKKMHKNASKQAMKRVLKDLV